MFSPIILFQVVIFVLFALSDVRSDCPDITKLNDLVGKTIILRKIVGNSTILYPDNKSFYFRINDDRVYLYREHQPIVVQNVKCSDSNGVRIEFSIENYLIGKRKVSIRPFMNTIITSAQLDTFLTTAFIIDTLNDNFVYYSRCLTSGLIHSTLCNHVCDSQESLPAFYTPTQSNDSLCVSCFGFLPLIPDIVVENALAANFTSYCFSNYRQISDSDLISRIKIAADNVLAHWPLALLGYHYRFILIDSDEPNAMACPGGTIFINIGLLRIIDSQRELEAVLCHEIAHVELRHGYRQFKKEQSDSRLLGILGVVLGAAVGAAVENGTGNSTAGVISYEFMKAVMDMAAVVAARGYSREYEREADRMVELFALKEKDAAISASFVTVLRKLQYHEGQLPDINTSRSFDTHPSLTDRIIVALASQSHLFEPIIEYQGFDEYGNLVATLRFIAISEFTTKEVRPTINGPGKLTTVRNKIIFGEITTTPYLQEQSSIKQFTLGGYRHIFDNRADTKLLPTQKTSLIFYNEEIDSSFNSTLQDDSLSLELSLKNIKEWKKVPSK